MPFVTCKEKFDEIIKSVKDSEHVSDKELEYLNGKLESKKQWAKCIMKEDFCGGICTTSRIEGLHGVLRRYLNSNSSLQGVFNCFRSIEEIQLQKFQEEFLRHKKQAKDINSNPLQLIKKDYHDYINKKITPKFCKALNYILEPNGRSKNSW